MSSEIKESCLGEIVASGEAALQTGPFGTMLKASEYSKSGTPVISVGEIREGFLAVESKTPRVSKEVISRLPRFLLEENDIVFGRKGSTHRNALIKKEEDGYFLGSDGIRLRINSDTLCPKFISYQLRSKKAENWLKMNSEGTTMPSLNQDILSRFPITILPTSDQKAIAHILGTLDSKIELNRKTNETLEGIAKALFKSWFVDFDPVKARAAGRPTGLPDEISELFPDSLEESEMGEIPSGWKVDSFTSQFNILGGGTPKTSIDEFWGGDLPWFSVVDAPYDSDCWVVETQKLITRLGLENCSSDLFRKGTTIISARGTVGKVCLVGVPMAMNQSCYALQSKQEKQDTYCYYSTKEIVELLKARSHGSVFSTITRETLKSVDVCRPEQAVINAFEELSSPFMGKIKFHVDESRTLTSLRNALLPRLMSGELKVLDAEKMLEEAGV